MNSHANASILLVGSVPGASVEAVFDTCASAIGEHVFALPDGELEDRNTWVVFLAWNVFRHHPDVETVSAAQPAPGKDPWIPSGYDDPWLFRLRDGVTEIAFDSLGYAEHARRSYATFTRLRSAGRIPAGVRMQVCLPLTESAFRWFFMEEKDFTPLRIALRAALEREVAAVCEAVPPEDLAIQWDVCNEILAVEANDYTGQPPFLYDAPGDPFDRYLENVQGLAARVPADVPMGIHLCYGDLGHRHLMEPQSLATCVRMANAAVATIGRSVDFFHVPVPRERNDDAYFAPLAELDIGAARLFIGLVHHTDGLEGTLARLRVAERHLDGFGISTECGFGRRPQAQIAELLEIHARAAAAL